MPATNLWADVRVKPFWEALRARLSVPVILDRLKGGKVYLEYEEYGESEGAIDAEWGRVLVRPGTTLWPGVEREGYRGVQWQVRTEINRPRVGAAQYDVAVKLEHLQTVVYGLLSGWTPTVAGLAIRRQIWRQEPPQPMPEREPGRDLWWLGSLWRCELMRP